VVEEELRSDEREPRLVEAEAETEAEERVRVEGGVSGGDCLCGGCCSS
jgi:hypothetical protein